MDSHFDTDGYTFTLPCTCSEVKLKASVCPFLMASLESDSRKENFYENPYETFMKLYFIIKYTL